MKPYDFARLEPEWQDYWRREGLFRALPERTGRDCYLLMMFPYPSGTLHVGHGRNYIMGDALARFLRMRGFNVLAPMGWDAFGLPAENYAIAHGVHPAESTRANIESMRRQFGAWGIGYDWDREIASCHPGFYRWTQWLFLRLYEKGLAYRRRADVNWCPSCKTVLANEQVVEGACERCGTAVVQRELEQWFLRITAFAERLLADLTRLPHWPERVRAMQANWIGRSEGAEIDFALEGEGSEPPLRVFTTRPDTLFGVTFLAVAPEHARLPELVAGRAEEPEILRFATEVRSESGFERAAGLAPKRGLFTGRYARHPFTGERLPIWVANFVLTTYGTGVIMAVPAHDQRDFEFARAHDLPVRLVIQGADGPAPGEPLAAAWTDDGRLVDSGSWSGQGNREGGARLVAHAEAEGFGAPAVHFRLRDWLISRQRYWGAPIPILYCDGCGEVPVPDADLPVELPRDVEFRPTGDSPLRAHAGFVHAVCPRCGGAARRETDTMDTFMDSSWYFLRFISPRLDSAPFDRQAVNAWLPVDQYVGGIEHAILHLLYARFITKFLKDIGWVEFDEPFARLFTQGMITKEAWRCHRHGWVAPAEVRDGKCPHCGEPAVASMQKMAKSKLNVVAPASIIATFGADTERLFTLFMAPPEKESEWSDEGVRGASRFLHRVWRLVQDTARRLGASPAPLQLAAHRQADGDRDLRREIHRAARRVTEDIDTSFHFNTAIAALMEFSNALSAYVERTARDAWDEPGVALALKTLVQLLHPFAPHITEELWRDLGGTDSVLREPWPVWDEAALARDEVAYVITVNGKVRSRVTIRAGAPEDEAREAALADLRVVEILAGRQPRKVVVVPDRLVNVVV